MTRLGNVIKIPDLHILFSNLWFLSLLVLCNFLPFFKAGVFVLFDSFRGCRVVLCSGHPDPVYFRYGSSSPTFDTDPPLRRDLTYFPRESSQLSNAQLFHSLLFTVSVKRCQKVFKKKNTFGTTTTDAHSHRWEATVAQLNQSVASRNFFCYCTVSLQLYSFTSIVQFLLLLYSFISNVLNFEFHNMWFAMSPISSICTTYHT